MSDPITIGIIISAGAAVAGTFMQAKAASDAAGLQAAALRAQAQAARDEAETVRVLGERQALIQGQQAVHAEQVAEAEAREREREVELTRRAAERDRLETERDLVSTRLAFGLKRADTLSELSRQAARNRVRLARGGVVTTEGSPLLVMLEDEREIDRELDRLTSAEGLEVGGLRDQLGKSRYAEAVEIAGLGTQAAKTRFAGTLEARGARLAAEETRLSAAFRARSLEQEARLAEAKVKPVLRAGRAAARGTILTGLGTVGMALGRFGGKAPSQPRGGGSPSQGWPE